MNKKTKVIIITLVILIITAVLIILINYLKKPKQETYNETKLLSEKVYFPSFSQDRNVLYYYSTSDQPGIYQYSLKTKEKKKLFSSLENVQNIIWAPDHTKAIIAVQYFYSADSIYKGTVEDNDSIIYWLINLTNKQLTKISSNTLNASFSSDGTKIIAYNYFYPDKIDSFNICDNEYKNCKTIDNQEFTEGINLIPWDSEKMLVYAPIFESGNAFLLQLNLNTLKIDKVSDAPESNYATIIQNKIIGSSYIKDKEKDKFFIFNTTDKKVKWFDFEILNDKVFFSSDANEVIYSTFSNNKIHWFLLNIDTGSTKELLFKNSQTVEQIFFSKDNGSLWYISNDYIYELKK